MEGIGEEERGRGTGIAAALISRTGESSSRKCRFRGWHGQASRGLRRAASVLTTSLVLVGQTVPRTYTTGVQ